MHLRLFRKIWATISGVSTRYLIVAALVTGLVILAASAVQLLMAR